MAIAASYPFLDVLWTMFVFFAFFIWIWLLFTVFADLFRRHDASGWAKAAWIVFIIILPYLGVLVYIIAEHKGMADRSVQQAQQAQAQFDDYVQSVASQGDPASQIANAKKLLDSGDITQAEFDQIKAKALA
jgi:phospholipase D-like protein/putative oligomerization/nucleic acid binding protein